MNNIQSAELTAVVSLRDNFTAVAGTLAPSFKKLGDAAVDLFNKLNRLNAAFPALGKAMNPSSLPTNEMAAGIARVARVASAAGRSLAVSDPFRALEARLRMVAAYSALAARNLGAIGAAGAVAAGSTAGGAVAAGRAAAAVAATAPAAGPAGAAAPLIAPFGGASLPGLLAGVAGFMSFGAVASYYRRLFDESSAVGGLRTRLEAVNDGRQGADAFASSVMAAAGRARGDYAPFADFIAKVGSQASDAFGSSGELVAFSEQLQKLFTISGATGAEKSAAMYQLSQALASGRLQGDEFRSISEAAPILLQRIAEHLGKSRAEVKDMSSKGLLDASVIKEAVLSPESVRKTEEAFARMPVSFADAMTLMRNESYRLFAGVHERIAALFSGSVGQNRLRRLIDVFSRLQATLSKIVEKSVDIMGAGLDLVLEHWDALSGVVGSVALALGSVAGAFALVTAVNAGAALLANPWFAVAAAVGLVVSALSLLNDEFNKIYKSQGSLLGRVGGTVFFIAGAFANLGDAVTRQWERIANVVRRTFEAMHMAGELLAGRGNKDVFEELLKRWREEGKELKNRPYGNLDQAFAVGSNWADSLWSAEKLDMNLKLPFDLKGLDSKLAAVERNTAKTARNTANDNLLKWLKELAERSAVNRFTTQTLKVEFTANNNITDSSRSVDGIIDDFTARLSDGLRLAAEGVYSR